MLKNGPNLWPAWTEEQRMARLTEQAYGNLRIENPEVTKEQIAQFVELRQKVRAEIVRQQ